MKIDVGRFQIRKDNVFDLFILSQLVPTKEGFKHEDISCYFSLESLIEDFLSQYLLHTDTKEIQSVESILKEIKEFKQDVYNLFQEVKQ